MGFWGELDQPISQSAMQNELGGGNHAAQVPVWVNKKTKDEPQDPAGLGIWSCDPEIMASDRPVFLGTNTALRKARSFEPVLDDALRSDMADAYVAMRGLAIWRSVVPSSFGMSFASFGLNHVGCLWADGRQCAGPMARPHVPLRALPGSRGDDEKREGIQEKKSYTTPRTLLAIMRLSQAGLRIRDCVGGVTCFLFMQQCSRGKCGSWREEQATEPFLGFISSKQQSTELIQDKQSASCAILFNLYAFKALCESTSWLFCFEPGSLVGLSPRCKLLLKPSTSHGVRMREAHARARFSDRVERQDFDEAMRLMKASKDTGPDSSRLGQR